MQENKREKKVFTYDFDGNIIVVVPLKTDKLPQQMSHIKLF